MKPPYVLFSLKATLESGHYALIGWKPLFWDEFSKQWVDLKDATIYEGTPEITPIPAVDAQWVELPELD